MERNQYTIPISIVFLGICILSGSWLISNSPIILQASHDGTNATGSNPALMTEAEAARYLKLSDESFRRLIIKQMEEKSGLSSYSTYRFIPFIEIDGTKYYNIDHLDKWVEYNMLNK